MVLTALTIPSESNNVNNSARFDLGIKINGKLLVDSRVTVNAPSIAPTGCSVGTKTRIQYHKISKNQALLVANLSLTDFPKTLIL